MSRRVPEALDGEAPGALGPLGGWRTVTAGAGCVDCSPMGGVRNGNGLGASADTRQEPPRGLPESDVQRQVDLHLQAAAALLREGSAPRAFGELVRASRSLPMTRRLAAAIASYSFKAGTEPAAIMVLGQAVEAARGELRCDVRRQLARVLRRVDQLPRAIEVLDALLVEAPTDRRALRVLEALLPRVAPPPREKEPASPAPSEEESLGLDFVLQAAAPILPAPSAEAPAPPVQDAAPVIVGVPEPEAPSTGEAEAEPPIVRGSEEEQGAAGEADKEPPPVAEAPPPVAEAPPAPAPEVDFHSTKTIEFEALSLEDVGGRKAEPEPPAEESPAKVIVEPSLPSLPPPPRSARPRKAPSKETPTASAARAGPPLDRAALQRLEAQLIARKKWRELAQLYLDRADRAQDTAERAEALTRLAELLENELQDPAGAARTYGDIFALTGDRAALQEQVRLLGLRGDPALVQRALDEAVKRAATAKARGAALLTRAERALAAGQTARAWADFNAAEALIPGSIPVLAGLLRCAPDPTRAALLSVRLRDTLAAAARRTPDRLDALRTLANVAESSLRNPRLAQWAWTEVLGEEPEDPHARGRLMVLARELKDSAALAKLLREQLSREPRGPAAREARLELVATLESSGDADGALAELRQAVRMEPGHKEAWLLLVERCTARGQWEESAWAQEHAATATEDEVERMRAWAKLGAFCRDVLKDPARAQVFLTRAENMRRALEEGGQLPPESKAPRAAPEAAAPFELEQGVALGDEDVPVPPTSVLSWEAPPGKMEPARRRARVRAPGAAATPALARPVEKPAEKPVERPAPPPNVSEPAALKMLRERPLEAGLYRVLAEAFDARGLTERGELMQELADALEGRETPEPRLPRVRLTAEDRAGLRHPGLRTPSGELFACVGLALCRLFPAYGPAAGTNIPLLKELGPGAPAAVEAIEAAASVLQLRPPEIILSEESGPPFTAVHASNPRILVGKRVVQQEMPAAELRFHAGRALFCLAPDLLALRSLKKDQLLRGLSFLSAVLYDEEGEAPGPEGRVLRDSLPPRARERAAKLLEPGMRKLDIPALADAAWHSANRAGLVACGSVGTALAVLRSRRALESEMVELVRFAASERYLELRTAEG